MNVKEILASLINTSGMKAKNFLSRSFSKRKLTTIGQAEARRREHAEHLKRLGFIWWLINDKKIVKLLRNFRLEGERMKKNHQKILL